MAPWRSRARKSFPELKQDLANKAFTPTMLFHELLPQAERALKDRDDARLRAILTFAEGSLRDKDADLSNAAGVAFFEHLVDDPALWPRVIPWISPGVIALVRPLWAARLGRAEYEKFDRLIRDRTITRYRELDIVRR